MAHILLAVTGSIASYKSADLVSSLKKQGHQVTVLMTQAATEFIQPLTLQVLSQNYVHLDVMKEPYPELPQGLSYKQECSQIQPLSESRPDNP